MNLISRKYYADWIDKWLGKGQIIVLVGQRRVGKSYVMKDFVERHKNDSNINIIYIDKEQKSYDFIKTNRELDEYIDGHLVQDRHNCILVDEVQDIEGWERSARNYRTYDNVDVIVTGSNAKMLSGELGTLLSGRYVEILVNGLTYNEFVLFHGVEDSDDTLLKYLQYGGLPGLRNIGLENSEMFADYMSGVFNTIVLKDVMERHNIRNIPFMYNLIAFIADTVGKMHSATSIVKFMKSQRVDVSTNVVLSYMSYFNEAMLTHSVGRYDIHGKRLLETSGKNYFGDIGLRNYIVGGDRNNDVEKVMENAVYNHLIHLGYEVKVGQLRAGEIDFVCTKMGSRAYFQVAYLVSDELTRKREFGNLRQIPDNYPKYVISATPMLKRRDEDGIVHIHLREFLKEENF